MCESLPANNTCLRFGTPWKHVAHLSENIGQNQVFDPYLDKEFLIPLMLFTYTKSVTWKHINDNVTESALKRLNKTHLIKKSLLYAEAMKLDILDTEMVFRVFKSNIPQLFHVSLPMYQTGQIILSTVPSETDEHSSTSEPMKLLILDSVIFLCTIMAIVVVSVTYLCITRRSGLRKREINFSNLFRTVWIFLLHLILNTDLSVLGRRLPTRILLGSWTLASFVLIWCYYSSMKLEMVISGFDPVNSIEDLLRKSKMEPYITSLSFKQTIEASDSTYTKFRERMALNGHYSMHPEDVFFQKFYKGTAFLFCQNLILDTLIKAISFEVAKQKRLLHVGESVYEMAHVHMIFNKKLPANVIENLNYVIGQIVETRQTEPRMRKAFFDYRKVLHTEKEQLQDAKGLSLRFLSPIFIVYLYGIALSVFAILVECISKFSLLF